MFSRLSNFSGPMSIFSGVINSPLLPPNLLLHLDSGASYSYYLSGGSYLFPQNGYLECISDDFKFGSSDFTLELWFKYADNGNTQGVISNYSFDNSIGVRMYITPDGLLNGLIYQDPIFGLVQHPTTITENEWHHAAIVRTGTTFSIYLDGAEYTHIVPVANLNDVTNSKIHIGKPFNDRDIEYFLGSITNVRVSNSAVYTSSFTPTYEQLQPNGNTLLLALALDESKVLDYNTDTTPKIISSTSVSWITDTPITTNYIHPFVWSDISGNNNDFSFIHNSTIINDFGGTIYFTGSNFATGSDFGTLQRFTLDTWVNIKNIPPAYACYFTNIWSDPNDINMFLGHNIDGNIYSGFYYSTTDSFITSTPFTPTLNTWYNFTTTVESNNLTFFINGETHSVTSLGGVKPSSSNLGYIIGKNWSNNTYVDGNISIVKVWDGALTYSTINDNYNQLLDRFTWTLDVNPSNWDASASNIEDLRSGLFGTVSGIGYSNERGGSLTFVDQSYIDFGNPESLNQNGDISFLIWIKFTDFTKVFNTGVNTIAKHYGDLGQNDFQFSVKDFGGVGSGPYKMNFYTANNYGVPGNEYDGLFDSTEIDLDNWYLLGFTLQNNGDLTYYVNGLTSSVFNDVSRIRANTNFTIGSPNANYGITGNVGKFRFYNRVLSPQEVLDFYNQNIPVNGSLVFNGANYLSGTIPYTIGTGSFTAEAWIKSNNSSDVSGVISTRITPSQPAAFAINLNSGNLEATCGTDYGIYTIDQTKWNHVAIVRDNLGIFSSYINGICVGSFSQTSQIDVQDFVVGRYWVNYDAYYFDGLITNLRISSEALYTDTFAPQLSKFTASVSTQLLIPVNSVDLYSDLSNNNISVTQHNNVGFTSSLPDFFITDGLLVYLDATIPISYGSDGGGTWYDLSGNNNDATLINGSGTSYGFTWSSDNDGVVQFDGYGVVFNGNLASRGEINLNLSGGDCTIIYGTKFLQNTPGFRPSGRSMGGKNENFVLGTWNNSVRQFFTAPSGFVYGGVGNQNDLNWHIYTGVMGSSTKFWNNDTKLVNSFLTNAIGPNGIVLASDGIYGESSNCQISFVLVYDRVLTDEEVLQTYNYFKSRFF